MDFGKYIHELLLENDVVIIPGFGAFISEYKPAEISNNSDEIKPPSKIISFNQQIRNNDGLLVGLVAEKKRISHFDALKQIEKERENILYQLDSGDKVEVEEVGILFYTEENKIGFKAEVDENLLLDSFGLEATTILIEEVEIPVVAPPVIVEEEKIEELSTQAATVEEEETLAKEKIEKETVEESTPIPAPKPEPETPRAVQEEKSEEKKKKGGWWLFLILIPLIAVSMFIFMKGKKDGASDKQIETKPVTKVIEQPAIISQDTANADTVEVAPQDTLIIEKTKESAKTETDPDTPKYYLVGGSFSVEENAETYLKELKVKGFDAFHVGKKGRFFIVGIGTYDTFAEAEKAKKDYMSDNSGSEVWVWKK